MKNVMFSIHLEAFNSPLIYKKLEKIDDNIAKEVVAIEREKLDQVMYVVGERGCVFCPSTFKDGKKSRENFEQSQLFVLSFGMNPGRHSEEDVTFAKIMTRAKRYGIPVLFAYEPLVFKRPEVKLEQFTIVFLNETPITDLREAEAMQRALMMIFPEADKDCSVLKLHRGGHRLLYASQKMRAFNTEWLMMNMCLYLKDRYGPTNYKRKLAEYARAVSAGAIL